MMAKVDAVELSRRANVLRANLDDAKRNGTRVPNDLLDAWLTRFEGCVGDGNDDAEVIEREKAMLKAFQEIAVSVEGIRSDLAKAAGLVPIGSGGTARIKT